ncbi:hypothetical protein [Thermococcus aciditolerans]|uniref:Uncharacterized protein n=1 Tax=Thermococcus aciditolerans TaxID=2598455 RepID=A0A5C0SK97_9EURY|nr:hypothetical protein [Thermococcus aciditolerans]QEK14710.1 hypothetical protein FPV09_05940 [Thermococcus aciditolerans]
MGKRTGFILSFLEGFCVTLNPFTMFLALWFGSLIRIILRPSVTPGRNALFLLGAFVGFVLSLLSGEGPFYKWGLWWIPTFLLVAALAGIPLMRYLDGKSA